MKIDEDGSEIWRKQFNFSSNEFPRGIFHLNNGSLRIAGSILTTFNDWDLFLIKTDSLGNIYSSALTGSVHLDPQSDCLPDPTESPLPNCLVQATGNLSFATLTDADGHFTLPVDTGTYEVTVTPPGPYWEVCNSPTTVNVAAFYDTTTLDFPVSTAVDCPYLEVDISAPFLRRCFDNTYTVHYCNYGTLPAEDASVEVTLDPYLSYQSSTIPFSTQNGNTLFFDLGDVAVNECGDFQITTYLDCDSTVLGQTHCTEAHIFPDSLCIPTNAAWDGSSIELNVDCAGDSVVFIITNTGTGDMAQPLDYIIIEDQIVLLQGTFDLEAGQSTTVAVAANGTTFHMEAQQSPEHPSGTFSVGTTIEGCGGWLSLGFFLQWANGNPNPFVDVDCQTNIGSYDPNEKVAFPGGFTEQHLIEPGQDIEYLLRFQNTGTDTAFKVVVVDVLPSELDLASVRPGASSHPYTYSVTPEGWPVFTFENIVLPDSNVNEPGSHGFVRFKASQKPGLAGGDEILNTALIYFDFNAPVRTNTTIHRIGQVFPWSVVGTKTVLQPKATFRIMPNPLSDSAILQVEGIEPGELRLTLTDVNGRTLRMEKTVGTSFEFFKNDLPSGVYFFKIEKDGAWIGSGKLMVR
ncbi:MAG: T9SS type A sorting domain-containing protein [Saprospiraceae bacterium]